MERVLVMSPSRTEEVPGLPLPWSRRAQSLEGVGEGPDDRAGSVVRMHNVVLGSGNACFKVLGDQEH